jgi:hypothetical protein
MGRFGIGKATLQAAGAKTESEKPLYRLLWGISDSEHSPDKLRRLETDSARSPNNLWRLKTDSELSPDKLRRAKTDSENVPDNLPNVRLTKGRSPGIHTLEVSTSGFRP